MSIPMFTWLAWSKDRSAACQTPAAAAWQPSPRGAEHPACPAAAPRRLTTRSFRVPPEIVDSLLDTGDYVAL